MVVWFVVCGWSELAVQRVKEEVLMAGGGRLESNVQRAKQPDGWAGADVEVPL